MFWIVDMIWSQATKAKESQEIQLLWLEDDSETDNRKKSRALECGRIYIFLNYFYITFHFKCHHRSTQRAKPIFKIRLKFFLCLNLLWNGWRKDFTHFKIFRKFDKNLYWSHSKGFFVSWCELSGNEVVFLLRWNS